MREPLYLMDKIEWRDVARKLRPDWTDAQFDEAWADFVERKQRGEFSAGQA